MEEISGKDLGFFVYIKLFSLFALNIVPAALPLAILLSSLMSFGGLGEHRELTAIKSSGISLIRILQPVFFIVSGLTIGLFFYGNTISTWANLEMYSLLYDIKQKKPTMEFKEGIFYNGLPGYRIKIGQKLGKEGDKLKEVMIYDHTKGNGNTDVILADSGVMYTILNDAYLVLELFDGESYAEFQPEQSGGSTERYLRSEFKKSKIVFNLSAFAFERTEKELFRDHKLMKNMDQLQHSMDSLEIAFYEKREELSAKMQKNYRYQNIQEDSLEVDTLIRLKSSEISLDSVLQKAHSERVYISRAINKSRAIKSFTSSNKHRVGHLRSEKVRNGIEYWRKIAIPFSCIILFLIGAPLGAIIKKGGLGLPVIISILFFIILYIVNEQGRKMSLHYDVDVWFGMWMSNIYLFPAGLFFLQQARNDSNILELDFWKNIAKKILFIKR